MGPPTLQPALNGVPNLELPELEGKDSSRAKLVADLNDKAPFENSIPVQAYEDGNITEVPSEFLFKNPKHIPTRIWGQDDASLRNDFVLPVIDMAALTNEAEDGKCAEKVIVAIGKACEEWGYFQAVNHGIPVSLVDRLLDTAGEVFRLPLEWKNIYAAAGGMEGNGRLGVNLLPQRAWNDMMRHTVRPRLTEEEVEKRIPAKPAHYRAVLEEYTETVEKLLDVVWTSLSVYLDLQPNALQKTQEDGARLIARLNYYPKCPEPEKVMGVGPHEDLGMLTVLITDQVGGLQVQRLDNKDDDVWLDVKPLKGSLLVNIGKQLEHLSNGRFRGMWHRALVNGNEPRYSIAFFANPSDDCIISPVQELLEKSQEAPHFRPLRFGDYIPNLAADVEAGVSPDARYKLTLTTPK